MYLWYTDTRTRPTQASSYLSAILHASLCKPRSVSLTNFVFVTYRLKCTLVDIASKMIHES